MTGILRRIIFIAVVLTLLLAIMPIVSQAAPAPPVFGAATALFAGQATVPGGKNVATDGNNYYMALMIDDSNNSRNEIKVARIPNSGKTVESAGTAVSGPYGLLTDELSLAVSDTGQKTVHLVWGQGEGQPGLYYSWAADANLDKWSAPVRINGKNQNSTGFTIVVNKKGDRHVIFIGDGPKIYYTSAPAGKTVFSEPVELPGTPLFDNRGVDVALDPGGNLHVAFIAADKPSYEPSERVGLHYTRLTKGAKKWSAAQEVIPLTAISGKRNISIAALDSNVVFIASALLSDTNLEVYKSLNGGAVWTKSIVSTGRLFNDPNIAVAPDKTVMIGSGFFTNGEAGRETRIFRSSDGVTWSTAAVIPGLVVVNLIFDAKGKAAVITSSTRENDNTKYFNKEQ